MKKLVDLSGCKISPPTDVTCNVCNGTGKIGDVTCTNCYGVGSISSTKAKRKK